MKITNEFTVHTTIERAWQVLTDLEGIAPCMPGAQLTGVEGDTYKGKVKVKVGPVISEFAGTARFAERDEAGHRAVIDAKGRDARAGGNASALVTAVLTPAGESTQVSVDTDLRISGKLAQFGSGMIKEVSGKLLAQFVSNLEAKLATEESQAEESQADEVKADEAVKTETETVTSDQADRVAPVPATIAQAPPATTEAGQTASDQPSSDRAGSGETTSDRRVPEPVAPVRETGPAAATAKPVATEEPEPLDLLSVAGSSIYKRAIPVVVGVVVVGAIIAWAIARR